jgi:hypothetical protein
MSSDTEIRQAYTRATDSAPAGPDLAEVLALGRGARQRRTRLRVAGATGVAAAVVAAVVAAGVLVPRLSQSDDVAVVVPAAPPAATDFVAGTDVDETMAEVVASHLPALGQPRDVFPSDSDHNGPMPDADFARAEDWQAEYDHDGDLFRLMMVHPAAGPGYDCPSCTWSEVPGGRVSIEVSQRLATDGTVDWRFLVTFASDSGFRVTALEEVGARTRSGAESARTFTDEEMLALARDPQLTFPAPVR